MSTIPHVALLIETSNRYCRDFLQGVTAYIQEHRCWSVYLAEHHRSGVVPDWIRNWKGDGIIARINSTDMAAAIADSKLPTVNVSSTDFLPTMPTVVVHEEVGVRLIVEHLLERGYREFAFCGDARYPWSAARQELFIQYVEKAGCPYSLFITKGSTDPLQGWEEEQAQLTKWIQSLPNPVGVFASYDFLGKQVLDACLRANVAVPGQVAVISTGDDGVVCELTTPPMSSLTQNPKRAGYEAAKILDQLMRDEYTGPRYVEIEPIDVHTRQSTDVMAIDDPDIAAAMQYVYQHACDGINVSDLLKVVPVSRRKLEFNFKRIIGRTPREEILRIKLEHAKRLLVSTDLYFSRIAESSGFTNASHLGEVFRREIGMSPSQYREQLRKVEFPQPD